MTGGTAKRASPTPLNGYTVNTFDNLDRMTQVQRYDSPSGTLIGQWQTSFDDRNRIYQRMIFAVAGGLPGNVLTENSWYDYSGNLLQQIAAGDAQGADKGTRVRIRGRDP
jgi:hypothetical protein